MCQCASLETTSAVDAGNLCKRTFSRFEFADPGTPAVWPGVPGCASVPRCAEVGQRVNGTGAGRGDLRIRTAWALRVDWHHCRGSGRLAGLAHRVGTPAPSGTSRGVPRCASVPGSGLVGSRALWSSATIAIDAQSDSASIPRGIDRATAPVTAGRAAGRREGRVLTTQCARPRP